MSTREADHVREPRRARVLETALAEARLDELEVEEAGEAVATPEEQSDRELEREQRQQPPRAHGDGDEREHADDELVGSRRALVDQLRVAVRVGVPGELSLHFGKCRAGVPGTAFPALRRIAAS